MAIINITQQTEISKMVAIMFNVMLFAIKTVTNNMKIHIKKHKNVEV